MAIFEDHNKPLRDHPDQTTCPTVLVMGGSGVIGNAICSRFTEANWLVGVHYNQHQSYAQKTCSPFPQRQKSRALFQADVRNRIQVKHMVDQFINQWGKLDVFVWAVGQTSDTITRRITTEQWDNTIQTNLTGLFYCLQTLGPIFKTQQTGSVLIVSSLSSIQGTTGQTAYAASKGGVLSLTRQLALDYAKDKIRVVSVCPGAIDTPMLRIALGGTEQENEELVQDMGKSHPIGRIGLPEDLGNAVSFLCSDKASFITGEFLNVDGGFMALGAWAAGMESAGDE